MGTYKSTKKFYFDLNQSYVITVASPRIIESGPASLNGIVTNVLMDIGLRVNAKKNITTKAKFILFKYFSGSMPSTWKLYSNKCYRYTSGAATFMSQYNKNPAAYEPYILAKSEDFSATWKSEQIHTVNFQPTKLGENIKNWDGEICLAVISYTQGSEHCYWRWNDMVGQYTLEYKQESLLSNLPSSFQLGKAPSITIFPYSEAYKHQITWTLGTSSHTTEYIPAGTKVYNSYTIPTAWRKYFAANSTTAKGTISVTTFDSDNSTIGDPKEYSINYVIDDYNYNNDIIVENDSIVRLARTNRFTNSMFNNYLVSNYDTFYMPFSVDLRKYSAQAQAIFVTYNGVTKPATEAEKNAANVNGKTSIATTDTKTLIHVAKSKINTIQVKITDKRGKIGVLNCSYEDKSKYAYLTYTAPVAGTISYYRGANTTGTRDDLNGVYGIVNFSNYKASFSDPALSIDNTISLILKTSKGVEIGNASTTVNFSNDGNIILCFRDSSSNPCELLSDEEYIITGTITDKSGYSQPISGKISSSNYLLHFRYGTGNEKQKSIGIGRAGRDLNSYTVDNTSFKNTGLLTIAYPIELARSTNTSVSSFTKPLSIEDGGTGSRNKTNALSNLGGFPSGGGILTGNLTISRNSVTSGGIYLKDSTGATPGALYYDKDLWIGSTGPEAAHHRGGTYISTGYNGTNGNDSIYISIPNASNNNSSPYKVYHTGNIFYSAANGDIPAEIPGGSAIAGMIWLKPIT